MIASFILTLMMSFVVIFFVAGMDGFSLASLVYSVFLIALFAGMTFSERKKKGSGASGYRSSQ